jgi:hypothetical protein
MAQSPPEGSPQLIPYIYYEGADGGHRSTFAQPIDEGAQRASR